MYGDRVVGCIDHHDEENKVPKDCGSEPRIVEKSGSCASHIVNHCKEAWDGLTHGDETAHFDSAWARIAMAPILIDTTNLNNKDKVTKHDIIAAETLEKILQNSSTNNRDGYYVEINNAKQDIGDLNLNEILRKDYKQWTEGQGINLGISSAVKDISFLLGKTSNEDSFWKEIGAFAESRKLSVCGVMTTSTHNGQFGRELLLLGLDEAGVKAAKIFEQKSSEELGLQSWESGRLDSTDGKTQWRRCWIQKSLGMSRKQVGPLLRKSIA